MGLAILRMAITAWFEAKFLLFPVLEVSVAKRSASFLLDLPPLSTLLLPRVRIRTRDFTLGDKGLSGIVGARHHGPKLAVFSRNLDVQLFLPGNMVI